MTGVELRELCLSFPDVTEKLTWGDAAHEGDLTFRVQDRIFVIGGGDGVTRVSIRTSQEQQADLLSAFPNAFTSAPYTGRFGWVYADLQASPDDVLRDVVRSAWERTAPKRTVAGWRNGA